MLWFYQLVKDKCLTHRLSRNVLRSTSCGMTGARGHGAIVYCLNSGSEVCRRVGIIDLRVRRPIDNRRSLSKKITMLSFSSVIWKGILETGGVMGQCVQLRTRNYGALDQTARVCFGVLCANRTREVKRDFADRRIRSSEGRVVNTPLLFKKGCF
ncbi:hypothetical protein TNCV_4682011 [Trichonephila clavipes]|nr:hypothetical protein TNCV_4682011 [Trichonephila clavipes]